MFKKALEKSKNCIIGTFIGWIAVGIFFGPKIAIFFFVPALLGISVNYILHLLTLYFGSK